MIKVNPINCLKNILAVKCFVFLNIFLLIIFAGVVNASDGNYKRLVKKYTKYPEQFNYETLYNAYINSDYFGELPDFYYSLNNKKFKKDKKGCIAPLKNLKKFIKSNFLSIAGHYYLMKCYELHGKAEKAGKHNTILQFIFEAMYETRDGSNQLNAIRFLTYSDLSIIAGLSELEFLDSYIEVSDNGERYYNVMLAKDEVKNTITRMYFSNEKMMIDYVKKKSIIFYRKPNFLSNVTTLLLLSDFYGADANFAKAEYYSDGKLRLVDNKEAEKYFLLVSKSGSFYGKTRLANFYLTNMREHEKYQEIIDLLLPGLEVGYTDSEVIMAALYYLGLGVEKDLQAYQLLFDDLQRQLGKAEACIQLAEYFKSTFEQSQVSSKVYELLLSAVSIGNTKAKLKLGRLYAEGYGGKQLINKAKKLFIEVKNTGNAIGDLELGKLYEIGISTNNNKQLAFNHYLTAAKQGIANAQAKVCWFYHAGIVVQANQKEAVAWCDKGANQGDAEAQLHLGMLAGLGLSAKNDNATNYKLSLYKSAAHKGLADAQLNLGAIYKAAGKKYHSLAQFWFWKAANQGLAAAQYELGHLYTYFDKYNSHREGIEWYELAAEQGHVEAMLKLGEIYERGHIIAKNKDKAKQYYLKAVEFGSRVAKTRLKFIDNKDEKIPFATLFRVGFYEANVKLSDKAIQNVVAGYSSGGSVSAKEKKFGLIKRTNSIPARLGVNVYIDYQLHGLPESNYKFKFVFNHFPYTDDTGVTTTGYTQERDIKFKPDYFNDFGWFYVFPYEVIAGDWQFTILYKDNVIFEKTFTTYLAE